jgi:hypothetical protein
MAIKEALKKLLRGVRPKGEAIEHPKISPDEMELASYKREEARDKIKLELAGYRKRKNREMLVGDHFQKMAERVHGKTNILNAPNILKGSTSILNGSSILIGGKKKKKRK